MAEMTRDQFLADFRKEFGEESIFVLGDTDKLDIEVRPSGSLYLDLALGGGYPKGRIIELSGKEKAGKTTILMMAIAMAQELEPDKDNAIIDLEHSFNPQWAETIGVDVEKLIILQPNVGAETVYDQLEKLVKSNRFAYIGLDSVAGLVPQAELEEGFDKEGRVGGTSKLNAKAMRKIVNSGILTESGTTLVFINQLRDAIGSFSPFGTPTTTGGGRSLRHAYTQQIEVSTGDYYSKGTGKDKKVFGQVMKMKVSKNKIAPPFRQASLDIYYDYGIDKVTELVSVAKELGVLQGTSWLRLNDPETGEVVTNEDGSELKWNGANKTVEAIKVDLQEGDGELYDKILGYVQYLIRG